MNLYLENIMDHYKHPRNRGKHDCSVSHKEHNPLCGDVLEMFVSLDNEIIEKVSFEGSGCAISQASADILSEYLVGKSVDFVLKMKQEDVVSLLGIEISGIRMKCAMLSLRILEKAVVKNVKN